jgi:hypothetical protein
MQHWLLLLASILACAVPPPQDTAPALTPTATVRADRAIFVLPNPDSLWAGGCHGGAR